MGSEHDDVKMVDEALEHQVPVEVQVESMTPNQVLDAYYAALSEHSQSVKESFRVFKKAIAWMSVFGLCCLQDQFDSNLTNSFQALPSFQKEFGVPVKGKGKNISYTLSPQQQLLISNIPLLGHITGLLLYGLVVDRLGNRKTLLAAFVIVIGTTFLLFFAKSFGMILGGSILHQATAGFIGAVAPAYALEFAPLPLRAYAPIYTHLCQNSGNLLASGVEKAFSTRLDQWAWRIPYAIQWAFPLPLLVAIWFAPKSPWWLVRHHRFDEALQSLSRLHNGESNDEQTLALIQHTVELERALQYGGSYLDLFKGVNLRRTETSFVANVSQELSGFALKSGAYFFEVAGLTTSDAFALQCGQWGLSLCATVTSMFLIRRMGRRGLWFLGFSGMALVLGLTGALALAPNQTPAVVWPQGVFTILSNTFLNVSIGPLAVLLATEIGSVQLRRKTLAIGLVGYDVATIVSGAISPYLINPTAANLKGKASWIPCGMNLLLLVYGYFRIPETQGRNSEELDILFAKKVPARKFKSYHINLEHVLGIKEAGPDPTDTLAPQPLPIVTLD